MPVSFYCGMRMTIDFNVQHRGVAEITDFGELLAWPGIFTIIIPHLSLIVRFFTRALI
jgi:hypothetical protein